MDDMTAAVQAVESTFNEALTGNLREFAIEKGWPEDKAALLSVKTDGGHLFVFAENLAEIEALEYGSLDTPPMPAVRPWLHASQALHEAAYWNHIFDAAWEVVL